METDQRRPCLFQVDAQRVERLAADRHDPFLGSLAVSDQDAGLEVQLAELQRDRLRRAQAAGVHGLEQSAIAQRSVTGALWLLEQAVHLVAAEHARQPRAGTWWPDILGRIGIQQALASHVSIEGAQAGDLAL